jgi:hypothetical protein
MLCPRRIAHQKNTILQTRSLSRRPMNTSRGAARRNSREIKDQIPNLAVEDICSSKLQTIPTILIAINDPKSTEIWSRLQHWHAIRISDDLGVVVIDDG